MTRFSVDFLGCKVSHVDAHEIRERLLADGHTAAGAGEAADVAVISSCCVTNEALAKSRKAAARAARTHGRVYVTGCGANLAGGGLAGLPANVTVVARRPEETPAFVAGDVGAIGCVGGLREVRRRVEQGHREVVLTGINLGCFRDRAAGYDLPRLVRDAGATPGLARLRLSSIEINHVSEALVDALRTTPTVARHLHVPLQSGDDAVLREMRRRYTTASYLKKLEPLAADFNLTADVIVGFPTEDDAAFERTLATVERAGLSRVHVFPYSPRPGTVTSGDDRVGPAVKKERGARLRELSSKLERRRWETKLGRRDTVLVDRPGRGYGDDYTPFLVEAPVGELVEVRAEALAAEGIRAVAA